MRLKAKKNLILDFDFTLCDSSTRENAHTVNDELHLVNYLQDTAEHDKALPLLRYILRNKQALEYKYKVTILTNRNFFAPCKSKIVRLVKRTYPCIHRGIYAPIYGDNFKSFVLKRLANSNTIFIDDDKQYLDIAKKYNARAICARELWHYDSQDFTELFFG